MLMWLELLSPTEESQQRFHLPSSHHQSTKVLLPSALHSIDLAGSACSDGTCLSSRPDSRVLMAILAQLLNAKASENQCKNCSVSCCWL